MNNFLYKFDDLFGKYLSQEEVLKRIDEYLDEMIKVDFSIVENDGISIRYNSKNGMHTVDYGGNGLDRDNYWQACVLFSDGVSEEEVQQRIEKRKN